MVARACLLEALQVLREILLREERGAVDAGQHLAVRVAAPVRARDRLELERLHGLRGGSVRAAAEIGKRAVAVERDALLAALDQVLDQLDLVVLALLQEALQRVLRGHVLALERLGGLDVLAHLLLDALEVILGDLDAVREFEVVVEAGVDRRPDRDLRAGVELADRRGEHVRGVVADQLERLGALLRDDLDSRVVVERAAQVAYFTIHLYRERSASQTFADRLCRVGAGRALG